MTLFRIHAYEVAPQRTSDTKTPPTGGSFPPNDQIRASLEKLFVASKLASQGVVDFRTDGAASPERTHSIRDLLMKFIFGSPAAAKSAAMALATRLSESMDERSPSTLLLLTGLQLGQKRRMTMWAFPQEEAFQFRSSGSSARIRILTDIFNQSSRLRKAAMFEGHERPTDFWSGRVLDLQSAGGLGNAADYWISLFLDCRFALEGNAGTRLLVKHLRSSYDALEEAADREQIYNAMVAIRTSPKHVWSLGQFANHYLKGEAKRVFVQSVPTDLRQLSFRFERQEFEDKLSFRVFRLEDDVFVSAPFGTIGNSVQIREGKERTLRCEGIVVDEKVRARHA